MEKYTDSSLNDIFSPFPQNVIFNFWFNQFPNIFFLEFSSKLRQFKEPFFYYDNMEVKGVGRRRRFEKQKILGNLRRKLKIEKDGTTVY